MKKIFYSVIVFALITLNACEQNKEKTDTEKSDIAAKNIEAKNDVKAENTTTQDTTTTNPNAAKVPKAKQGEEPIIEFVSTTHNFGEIKEGETVKHAFKFKNKGKTPLVIEEAKPGCGCTVPKWPKEPIPPGGESEIVAEFKTQGQGGGEKIKNITIKSNTNPAQTVLTFKAMINSVSNAKGPVKQ
ncbi:MAG: DUF1573 domain-containing protein [Bacteroidetes bacterium]|nr:MAG: DUF1573 domain-containing protein [Bacteroidota bacterium]TAG93081.1 MAG: DUF1573 domain-containing protein [Bacteroidota bacterium]